MKSGKNSLAKIVKALSDADIPFSLHKQEFSDKIEEFVSKRLQVYTIHLINSGNNVVLIDILEISKDKLEVMQGTPVTNALMLKMVETKGYESLADF